MLYPTTPISAPKINRHYGPIETMNGHPFDDTVIQGAVWVDQKKPGFGEPPFLYVLPNEML